MIEITEQNFQEEVLESEVPVAISFHADWCGPCKKMEPTVLEVEKRLDGRVKFGSVDTVAEKKLRIRFCVASLPTVSVVRNGKFIDVTDCLLPADELEQRIERVLTGELDAQLARRFLS